MSTPREKTKCPYCAEMINTEAIKCRYCGTWLDKQGYMQGWTRSRKYKKLLGVSSGLARHFNIHVNFIRLAFIILTFMGGWGIILYLSLWFLMPLEPPDPSPSD